MPNELLSHVLRAMSSCELQVPLCLSPSVFDSVSLQLSHLQRRPMHPAKAYLSGVYIYGTGLQEGLVYTFCSEYSLRSGLTSKHCSGARLVC
jgi:hypothetical protein